MRPLVQDALGQAARRSLECDKRQRDKRQRPKCDKAQSAKRARTAKRETSAGGGAKRSRTCPAITDVERSE